MTCSAIVRGLPSGYNRDFQETKGPMMRGLATTLDCVRVLGMVVGEMRVDVKRCIDAFTPDVFAADEALKMVTAEGIPFREAYKKVGLNLDKLKACDPVENILSKKHLGGPGQPRPRPFGETRRRGGSRLKADTARVEKVKKDLTSI